MTKGFTDLGNNIGNFFSNLGNNIGGFFDNLWNNLKNSLTNLGTTLNNIFDFTANFFKSLLDFFLHIFIPSDSQWEEIKQDYVKIGDTVKSHIPFVSLFSEELKKAQETVEKTDFLVINIPSFDYAAGGIGVSTGEQKCINVGQKYEPYRTYVRGGLFLIVVGLGFVYLIKHFLNYNSFYDGKGGSEK